MIAHPETVPTQEEIGPVQVLLGEADALAEIFPKADSAQAGLLAVDGETASLLAEQLGRTISDAVYPFYTIFQDDEIIGTAIVAEERGKYRPITFMAGVDRDLRIVDVRVLVYRESRGGEVQRTRFLRQYRKKSLGSPIRINRDIINITGATISVHALNAGVRKALAVAEFIRAHPEKVRSVP